MTTALASAPSKPRLSVLERGKGGKHTREWVGGGGVRVGFVRDRLRPTAACAKRERPVWRQHSARRRHIILCLVFLRLIAMFNARATHVSASFAPTVCFLATALRLSTNPRRGAQRRRRRADREGGRYVPDGGGSNTQRVEGATVRREQLAREEEQRPGGRDVRDRHERSAAPGPTPSSHARTRVAQLR